MNEHPIPESYPAYLERTMREAGYEWPPPKRPTVWDRRAMRVLRAILIAVFFIAVWDAGITAALHYGY